MPRVLPSQLVEIAEHAREAYQSEGWQLNIHHPMSGDLDEIKLRRSLENFIEVGRIKHLPDVKGFYGGHGVQREDYIHREVIWTDLLSHFWDRDVAVEFLQGLVRGDNRQFVHFHSSRLAEAMVKVARAYSTDEEVGHLIVAAAKADTRVAPYGYAILKNNFSGFQSIALILFQHLEDGVDQQSTYSLVSVLIPHLNEQPQMFYKVAKHLRDCIPQLRAWQLEDLINSAPEGWHKEEYVEAVMVAVLDENKRNTNWEASSIFDTYMTYVGFFRESARLCREVARDRSNPATSAMVWLAWLYPTQEATLTLLQELFRDTQLYISHRRVALQLLILFFGDRDDVMTNVFSQLQSEPDGQNSSMWRLVSGADVIETYTMVSGAVIDAQEREPIMRNKMLAAIAQR